MSSSGISMSGLITGMDSSALIEQLMQIERQPVTRIKQRISTLETQKSSVRELRTQLLALRSKAQNFRLNMVFDQFKSTTSDDEVLASEVSGSNPVSGSYVVDVIKLASATTASSSASLGDAIDPSAALNSDTANIATTITGSKFSINGKEITFDPDTESLNDVITKINASGAGVTASYDAATDKVTIANTTAGDKSLINFSIPTDSDEATNLLDVLGLKGATQANNASGSTQLTSTRNIGAVSLADTLDKVKFSGGATVTAGTFSINGVSITIDPTKDSVSDVLARINDSDANVVASYDSTSDSIRFVSKTLGSRTIRFESGTSNFLDITNLTAATQTAGDDAQFTINGGAVQTRNTNEVSDAISGVTLKFLSKGDSTVTVSSDDDAIVKGVQSFIDDFNASLTKLSALVAKGGAAEGDSSLRMIDDFLRNAIFGQVAGAGDYSSLGELGISTGDTFDSESVPQLKLNEDTFRDALRGARNSVQRVFSNTGGTGVADQMYSYLDSVTSTTGFLNARVKSNGTIDEQIESYNDQIDRLETRLAQKEARLKAQYAKLETMSATYKSQSAALSSLGSGYSLF